MSDALFAKMRAKGNGFAVGEVTGPGVERWYVFLHVQLAADRR